VRRIGASAPSQKTKKQKTTHLAAVVQHKHFTVLKWRHRARIRVQVRV
jgi:hypothetical protein